MGLRRYGAMRHEDCTGTLRAKYTCFRTLAPASWKRGERTTDATPGPEPFHGKPNDAGHDRHHRDQAGRHAGNGYGMSASTFDTHAAVTALRDAGLDEAPAVAIENTVRDAAGADRGELATRADLADVRAELADVRADVRAVRSELATIRWTIGLLAAFNLAIGLRGFGIL